MLNRRNWLQTTSTGLILGASHLMAKGAPLTKPPVEEDYYKITQLDPRRVLCLRQVP